jgi:hypothetical protein
MHCFLFFVVRSCIGTKQEPMEYALIIGTAKNSAQKNILALVVLVSVMDIEGAKRRARSPACK